MQVGEERIMKNDETIPPAIREYRMALEEYFKGKSKPKDEKESKNQMEGFMYWYNNVRKQSDTGKTPAEMYKDVYGKSPR
ncbi:MAG TPA: hypothetical protein VJH22_07630 [Candidatus Nanoarchaeia archaeon]|nr:hypothetical protein [Candidatus Nanoarchaeia archaeon]